MGKKPTTVAPVTADTTMVAAATSRFAMPHALVIIACFVTAAVLAPDSMSVQDVLLLLAGAGAIGSGVVLAIVAGSPRGSRLARLVRAYLSPDE